MKFPVSSFHFPVDYTHLQRYSQIQLQKVLSSRNFSIDNLDCLVYHRPRWSYLIESLSTLRFKIDTTEYREVGLISFLMSLFVLYVDNFSFPWYRSTDETFFLPPSFSLKLCLANASNHYWFENCRDLEMLNLGPLSI